MAPYQGNFLTKTVIISMNIDYTNMAIISSARNLISYLYFFLYSTTILFLIKSTLIWLIYL